MRLSVSALLFCGIANALWPSYGEAFLQTMASVYPGYHVTRTPMSILVGTLYAGLDGAVAGLLFGWIYNRLAGGKAVGGA
ncbi:MAG TPA: hypothetical protein VGC81_14905 [Candidatus Methylomirabilis sp.]|jgi:hypothetical protein